MARKKNKNGLVGLLIGPTIVFMALSALWKNETRFDYYRAAARTTAIGSLEEGSEGELISFSGRMDKGLTIPGIYVESFTGCLIVYRSAEIYCWDKDTDSENRDTWSQRWMGSVERNSRNGGIVQRLSSKQIKPDQYFVGDLEVKSDQIYFVDSRIDLSPNDLNLADGNFRDSFQTGAEYFFLPSASKDGLGDERISYSAIPVPDVATYFGKFSGGLGTAYDDEKRTGLINQIIGDSGVLHYLVAGERDQALASIKQDLARLKWIVRGIGTAGVIIGFVIFFSSIVGFLFSIPVLGWVAEQGVFIFSIALGVPLAALTILCAYFVGHPILLIALVIVAMAFIYLGAKAKTKGRATQAAIKEGLDRKYGHELGSDEIAEKEFISLVRLATSDAKLSKTELAFLYDFGKKKKWDTVKCDQLIEQAEFSRSEEEAPSSDEHLQSLIELALSDGYLSPYEMRTIRTAASNAGFDRQTVDELMRRVQVSAVEEDYRLGG